MATIFKKKRICLRVRLNNHLKESHRSNSKRGKKRIDNKQQAPRGDENSLIIHAIPLLKQLLTGRRFRQQARRHYNKQDVHLETGRK